jgi:prepilin-type processing-associated H-X9-DG protein
MKSTHQPILGLFVLVIFACCANVPGTKNAVSSEQLLENIDSIVHLQKSTIEGTIYARYILTGLSPHLDQVRPSMLDTNIVLSIACAFTRLDNNSIDGLFMHRGQLIQKQINASLGGLLFIDHFGNMRIQKREGMNIELADTIARFINDSLSCCQQIQLVRTGESLRFGKDKAFFQRRAVALFADGHAEIIESTSPILLQRFADDLKTMGVMDAVYTDMGGWDEGWIRFSAKSKPSTIGLMRTQTDRQSNWLYFERAKK